MGAPGGTGLAGLALLLSAAAAAVAVFALADGRKAPKEPAEDDADLLDKDSMENRLHDAEARIEAGEKRLQEMGDRLARAEKASREAATKAAQALARALPEGAGNSPSAAEAAGGGAPADGAKRAEIDALLAAIRDGKIPKGGVFAHFEKAKELGAFEEALAEMEKYAAAHRDSADAQADLSVAYLAKLLQVPDGPERGKWSTMSINACDEALKLEPEHWGAQFMKAMNLSQWPAFMGRQPEAIRTFEKLVEQQERSGPDPKFAQTYFHLGNTYRAAGNVEKAREAWRRGLERFPEDKQLKDQLDLVDKR